jgi:hypothetical protein
MLSPPEVPRNAERAQCEGRATGRSKSAAKDIIKAEARKPRPGQRQLLLRHLDGNLKDLIRDTQRLTVALEDHESLTQGCPGSQRWVKLARTKDQCRQMAL